jgi:hypothetical protein
VGVEVANDACLQRDAGVCGILCDKFVMVAALLEAPEVSQERGFDAVLLYGFCRVRFWVVRTYGAPGGVYR